MIFASAGYKVFIFDIESSQIEGALNDIKTQLQTFEKEGIMRGTLSAEKQIALIKGKHEIYFSELYIKIQKNLSEKIYI